LVSNPLGAARRNDLETDPRDGIERAVAATFRSPWASGARPRGRSGAAALRHGDL